MNTNEDERHHGPDERAEEAHALRDYDRDIGMNFDTGFGSLLDDSAAGNLANARPKRPADE